MAQSKSVRLVTEAALDTSQTKALAPIKNDVADLKVLGGLNPGSVNDASTSNLIETPGTQTNASLSSAIDESSATETAKRPTGSDHVMLQALIDAAYISGRPMSLRGGIDYVVSQPLRFRSGIQCNGNMATIKAAPGLNTHVATNYDRVNGDTGIVIRDLKFDGNGATQSAQFNTVEFMRVDHCTFDNLDVSGAKRNATFPNGTNGDGLCLIYSHYNTINGGDYHHNTYDGIKLRGSNHNRINTPMLRENGRSGIQLAFYSPTGPPYNAGEGIEAEGSNFNTIISPTTLHSTGIPHAFAPTTSGVYIHTGYRNTVIGMTAVGVRQGIGVFGGANDNEFIGGFIAINHVDRAAIDVEGGPSGLFRNSFSGITTRAVSGANGKHVRVAPGSAGAGLNRFHNCYFAKGTGTGDWTVDVVSGATDTWFVGCTRDGALINAGASTVWSGPSLSGGTYRMETPLTFGPVATTPSQPAANNVNVFVDSVGVICYQDSTGGITKFGYGTLTLPAGSPPPTADASRRGQLRFVPGVGDAYDRLLICRKREAGIYEWAQLA